MYTTIATSQNDIVYKRKFADLEEAYEAADEIGIAFYSVVLDHNGIEMTMQDIIDRLHGCKHRIIEVYFEGLCQDFAKCHVWFRCSNDKEIFDTVNVVGKDGVVYNGIVTDKKFVDVYPAHMGKAII